MQVEIGDELASYIRSKAVEAGFDSLDAYLLHLLRGQEASSADVSAMTYDQWRERYWAFVGRQSSRNPNFDDSRESIYLGP